MTKVTAFAEQAITHKKSSENFFHFHAFKMETFFDWKIQHAMP